MREKVGIYIKINFRERNASITYIYFYDLKQVTRGPINHIVREEKNFTLLL